MARGWAGDRDGGQGATGGLAGEMVAGSRWAAGWQQWWAGVVLCALETKSAARQVRAWPCVSG
jgi:hypothetical protein